MAQGKGSGAPSTQVNKLDNMLGSLQSDLNKLGVQTVAKGVCGACSKPIVGQVRRADGDGKTDKNHGVETMFWGLVFKTVCRINTKIVEY